MGASGWAIVLELGGDGKLQYRGKKMGPGKKCGEL